LDVSGEQNVSKSVLLRQKIYYHKFDNTMAAYNSTAFTTYLANSTANGGNGAGNGANWISKYDDYSMGLRLNADMKLSTNHQLSLGMNVVRDNHQSQSYEGYPWEEYQTTTYTLAAESNVAISNRISFMFGVSVDSFKQDTARVASDTYRVGGTTYYQPLNLVELVSKNLGNSRTATNPQFGITIKADERNTLRFTAGRKLRFPSQNELFGSRGNTSLRPQVNNSAELGWDYAAPKNLTFNASVFLNNVNDPIYSPNKNTPYSNSRNNSYRGWEFGAGKDFGRLSSSFAYTYLSTRDVANHVFTDYNARRKADYTLGYKFTDSFTLNLFGSRISPRYYNTATAALPAYTVINSSLIWNLKSLKSSFNIYVDNIMDKDYSEEEGYPQPGRTLRAEWRYSF